MIMNSDIFYNIHSGDGIMDQHSFYPQISYFQIDSIPADPFPAIAGNDIHIWRFSLTDVEKLPEPESCLSESELIQLYKYKLPDARLCYQIGHTALRLILSGYLHAPADKLDIRTNEYGKLYLPSESPVHFNISHAGKYIVLAFCRFSPVGIDIEEIYDLALADNVVKRFFHPDEAEEYRKLPLRLRQDWFFRRWTVREAYLKALGTGLNTPPESFYVREEKNSRFTVHPNITSSENLHLKEVDLKGNPDLKDHWLIFPLPAPEGYFCSLAFLAFCKDS